jgi:molybdopterin-guanine dinucleotide biosynthesis protein B
VSATAPPVFSVVAKSNTGKTTLLEKLIPELRSRGLSVAVVKHHSHLSSFDVPGKDTYRMAKAGADVVVGLSPVQVAVFHPQEGPTDLDAVIRRHSEGVDLVLTEGYKRGPYPKIEVHRSGRSDDLLCEPDELVAIVSDREWDMPVPQVGLDDVTALADILVAHLDAG